MISPLILIDGSSYFFRAFHALPPLTNSKGQPTGAIYGVANMVKKLIKEHQPKHLAVIFDAKGKTFRDELYPAYKANRAPMPYELRSQFQPLMQLLQAMGLPLLIIDGVEADDVIGTLAKEASEKGQPVIISTGDKDMAQLVNEHVTLINTMNNTSMDSEGVKKKFGVTPHQIIDYLTLVGDPVDNIPGVKKCGPKTAVKWLEEYQTLNQLIENAHKINGKIGENLRESLAHLPLSKELATIKTNCELFTSVDQLRIERANQEQLITLTQDFEFRTWLQELLDEQDVKHSDQKIRNEKQEKIVTIINSPEQLERLLNALHRTAMFAITIKTINITVSEAEIIGIALVIEQEHPYYLPVKHDDDFQQLDRDYVLNALKPILENDRIAKIGQNLKDDYRAFKHHGILLRGIAFDVMLESYVLNSHASRHDIDTLALKYLGHKTIDFEEMAGKGAKQLRFDQVPVSIAAPFAAESADITLQLHHKLYPLLDESLRRVFQDIEIPLLTILGDMEQFGVFIDMPTLKKHGIRLKARMLELENEAVDLAGKAFNLNSPKQLQQILFEEQKLPVFTKTPKGQPSTAEAVLQELAFDFRLPAVILEYRSLSKLVSTYIDALPKRVNPSTSRVHTCYNQAVAATGRLSSSEPNLQNIPIRSEEGRLIRTAFIAPEGKLLLAADYSQIELRIMAHLSEDTNLLRAFTNDLDIHTATASEIFQLPLDEVTNEHRRRAKAVNFGLIYGMSAFGLAKRLKIERQDAQLYMDMYFQRYPGVLKYMECTRDKAHKLGYVETLFGRRLYLSEINASNMMRQKAAERMAINAPMQGTAADIIKKAMLAIAQWQNTQKNPAARMIMQVHDELVFEVDKHSVEVCSGKIRQMMEETVKLSVPLNVSIGVGENWDEAH